jgi:hypothetical protein
MTNDVVFTELEDGQLQTITAKLCSIEALKKMPEDDLKSVVSSILSLPEFWSVAKGMLDEKKSEKSISQSRNHEPRADKLGGEPGAKVSVVDSQPCSENSSSPNDVKGNALSSKLSLPSLGMLQVISCILGLGLVYIILLLR